MQNLSELYQQLDSFFATFDYKISIYHFFSWYYPWCDCSLHRWCSSIIGLRKIHRKMVFCKWWLQIHGSSRQKTSAIPSSGFQVFIKRISIKESVFLFYFPLYYCALQIKPQVKGQGERWFCGYFCSKQHTNVVFVMQGTA